MARQGVDLADLRVGDRILIEGGGTTQGFRWKTKIKRITETLIVCEDSRRFNRVTGYPVPHNLNYAYIARVLPPDQTD